MILAADAQVARSILLYQSNVDKISHLTEDKILACAGPRSDCVNFSEYIAKNIALYELNNSVKLGTKATANFIRGEVNGGLATPARQKQWETWLQQIISTRIALKALLLVTFSVVTRASRCRRFFL